MNRLYIVEGLPCAGKSTTTKYIAKLLSEKGEEVLCVDEGTGNHPADYEFHAYVSEDNLIKLSGELQSKIKASGDKRENGYVIQLSDYSGDDFNTLLQYKIYDFLPWEDEKKIILDKWRDFVKNAEQKNYVFNCILLQNPMCETMMRFNFSEETSLQFISEILEIIKPLHPMVVYLHNSDFADRVKETAKEREGWLEAVIDYHVNGEYGKSIKAQGFDGYISCLEERQRRELNILDKLDVQKLVIENASKDWNATYLQIETELLSKKDTSFYFADQKQTKELYREFILPYFPADEVKPLKSILRMMDTGLYRVLYIEEDEKAVGVAFLTTYPNGEVYLLDYLAVKESCRSNGIGGKLLQACTQATDNKPVLIETEKVELAPNEEIKKQREKRNLFYERNHAIKTGVVSEIFGVTYDNWCLSSGQKLSEDQVKQEIENIYHFMVNDDNLYQKNVFIQ